MWLSRSHPRIWRRSSSRSLPATSMTEWYLERPPRSASKKNIVGTPSRTLTSICSGCCFHNGVMATAPYRSWLEISRSQIAENYKAIQRAVGDGVAVMPVVKADAYRHGAVEVSRVLVENGAEWLAVSNVEEGVALRMAGSTAHILVMADFLPAGGL